MTLCEHCRAEVAGQGERLPPPWFDHDRHTVAGEHLSLKRWQILEILWRRRDRVVSTDTLMTLLYSDRPDDPPDEKIIDVLVSQLRRDLEPTPCSIRTDWGFGYQLCEYKHMAGDPVLGEVADDVPLPRPKPLTWAGWVRNDKYQLAELKVGQSRRVDNAKLGTLKSACQRAQQRGHGSFTAGYDGKGVMRIWRVE